MDYEIKPVGRNGLRLYAKLFRKICGFSQDEPIDPVLLLDRLPDLEGFEDVSYEIVYGNKLPGNVPAQCIPYDDGYVIQIKDKIFESAANRKVGGNRMHIMHEIMHVFLDKLEYKPIFSRKLTKETPCFRRLEWAVMAIAGEVMMPYEATKNMSVKELMEKYGVSKAAAEYRIKH